MNNSRRSKTNKVDYYFSEVNKLFEFIIKTKLMEVMGIRALPVIDDAGPLLNSNNFPIYPYVIRGLEASTVCCLKPDVSRAWNWGDADIEDFESSQGARWNSESFIGELDGFESSSKNYFAFPKTKLNFTLPNFITPKVFEMLAAHGSCFINGLSEYGGAAPVAERVSGSKLSIITDGNRDTQRLILNMKAFSKLQKFYM